MDKPSGTIRIIGGKWRGRAVKVLTYGSLRPTPSRIRETLFNWLGQRIINARCLDLFAGTGILGFEALSRGAKEVTFVDKYPPAAKAILETAKNLNALSQCEIIRASALSWLREDAKGSYDVVFLDPPFGSQLLEHSIEILSEHSMITDNTLLYLEYGKALTQEKLPPHWELLKQKVAGEVAYHLVQGGSS